MLTEEQKKLLLEISTSCKGLKNYHEEVASGYNEICNYLEGLDVSNPSTSMDKDKIDNMSYLLALPIIEIFNQMNLNEVDSPDYIYQLMTFAYNSYKDKNTPIE